jgi:hypothetical protein
MDNDNDLVNLNDVDLDTYIAGKSQNALNKGIGNSSGKDKTFDDENKTSSVDGDPLFYEPYLPKLPRGSVEDIQNKLRTAGSRLRKDLNKSLKSDPQAWNALKMPASLHSAQRTLSERWQRCCSIALLPTKNTSASWEMAMFACLSAPWKSFYTLRYVYANI